MITREQKQLRKSFLLTLARELILKSGKQEVPEKMQMEFKAEEEVQERQTEKIIEISEEMIHLFGLEKLDRFLQDPNVQMIECPGENQGILLTRNERVESTGVFLSKEEINIILKHFSDKTRIPLITGVFRAAYGNLLITAIISEFIGARFIIQKLPTAHI